MSMYFFLSLHIGFDGGKPPPVSACAEIHKKGADDKAHWKACSDTLELLDFESVGRKKPLPRDKSVVEFTARPGFYISPVYGDQTGVRYLGTDLITRSINFNL